MDKIRPIVAPNIPSLRVTSLHQVAQRLRYDNGVTLVYSDLRSEICVNRDDSGENR